MAKDNSIGEEATKIPSGDESLSIGDMPTMRAQRRRFKIGDLILNRYRVAGELGQGGMGIVYRCLDETGGIDVALKALPPELSHNSLEMQEVRENFRLVQQLHHPNIAAIKTLEKDSATGDYYLIMECVEGTDLRRWRRNLPSGCASLQAILPIVRQVAAALDYAHSQKIIHRDIKPGNIMIAFRDTGKEGSATPSPRDSGSTRDTNIKSVKVLDFGLAAQIHSSMGRVSDVRFGTSGTGPYMAPEQWRGQYQDAATDQYALAAMIYELLCGHPPFEGHEMAVLREAVLNEPPPPIKEISRTQWLVLQHALGKERTGRFESCTALVDALASGKRSGSWRKATKPSIIGRKSAVVWLLAAGLLAAGIWFTKSSIENRQLAAEQARIAQEQKAAEEQALAAKQDLDREDAETQRAEAEARQKTAKTAKADELARDAWNNAQSAWGQAEKEFEVGNFEEASKDWKIAAELFQSSETFADAVAAYREAKKRWDGRKADNGEQITDNQFQQYAETPWSEAQRLDSEASGLERKNPALGKNKYEAALAKYQEAVVAVQKAMSVSEPEQGNDSDAKAMALQKIETNEDQKWTVDLGGGVMMEFLPIVAGSFMMGSETGDSQERPVHRVTLSHSFGMAKTEVTQRQYQQLMGSNPSYFQGLENPVERVSWNDAMEFCKKLTEQERKSGLLPEGYEYTLPTEAQWEYACRADTIGDYCSDSLDSVGWYSWNATDKTHPVGEKQPNVWGLHDMHGNVWEWCVDWLGPYNQESVSDPSGHLSGSGRVARGGAFRNSAADCRSAKRFGRIPSSSGLNFGFRPVFCRVSEKPGALRTSGGGGLSSQELPLSEAPTADWLKIHKLSVEGSVEPGTSLTVIMDVEYNLASMDEASLFFGFNTRQMNGYLFHGNDTEAAVKGQHRLIIRKSVVVPEWVKEKFDVQIDLKDKTGDRLFNGSRLATAARDIPLDRVSEVSPDSFPGEPDILEPPPPEDRGVDIADLIVNLIDYSGKVVKVEGVGRIAFFKKIEDGWYSATCSSKAMTSFSSRDAVLIPEEGLEVIDQIQANPVSAASFYIWVRSRPVLKGGQSYKMEAVGKRYRKSKNAYVW